MKLFGRKSKKEKVTEMHAFISGKSIPVSEVNDPVFASKTLGDGIAIYPEGEMVCAPCDGVVSTIAEDSKHAIGMTLNNGAEILLHIGLDTVSMNGKGFEIFVREGEKVKAGEKLMHFDKRLIESEGFESTCIMVMANADEFPNAKFFSGENVVQNESVICSFE